MKRKLISFLLLLPFVVGLACFGAMPSSHACCQKAVSDSNIPNESQVLPCCVEQSANTVWIEDKNARFPGLDGNGPPILIIPFLSMESLLVSRRQSALGQVFLKDQSNRYLELSVFLN